MPSASILIKAPIEQVYACISDVSSYPEFLSEIESAKIVKKGKQVWEAAFVLNLIKKINYTLRFEADPPHGLYWTLKEGEWLKSNSGSWVLKPKGSQTTEAIYTIDVTFGLWVPASITETLVAKNLPQTLKHFKKRAETLFRKASKESFDI